SLLRAFSRADPWRAPLSGPRELQAAPASRRWAPAAPAWTRAFATTRRGPIRRFAPAPAAPAPAASVHDDRADGFALVHQVEGPVDVLERHRVGDERVDVDLPLHVPVHDLRHVRAPARAAEGAPAPDAA